MDPSGKTCSRYCVAAAAAVDYQIGSGGACLALRRMHGETMGSKLALSGLSEVLTELKINSLTSG